MDGNIPFHRLPGVLRQRPHATAHIHGSNTYPTISGRVCFYQLSSGVLVAAQVAGLPNATTGDPHRVFAFHIHSGSQCTGTQADPFADALTHYNPGGVSHPNHAGDLPPLFGNHGYAFQVFFTDRFSVREIIHKTVIIHSGPDDFTSQPAGNAGEKIACGQIEDLRCGFDLKRTCSGANQ